MVKQTPLPKRVAVVDDDKFVRTMLADMLSAAGFSVALFSSAEEALLGLWEQPVDAVVTDVFLPRMNGLDLLRELRTQAWAKWTPCVAISGAEWPQAKLASLPLATRPSLMLQKPFDAKQLLSSLQRMVLHPEWTSPEPAEVPAAGAIELGRTQLSPSLAQIRVRLGVNELVVEYSDNLVRKGLFVRCAEPLPLNTKVVVELELPFRSAPAKLEASVVQRLMPGTEEARLHTPGMALVLRELPESLHSEIRAFLSGYRAGQGAQATPEAGPHLLLVGPDQTLPTEELAFLERHSVTCSRAASADDALRRAGEETPEIVVVSGGFADAHPEVLASIHARLGHARILVYGAQSVLLSDRIWHLRAPKAGELSGALTSLLGQKPRHHPRVALHSTARLRSTEGEFIARMKDVSSGGVCFLSEKSFAVGERLELEFTLAGSNEMFRSRVAVCRLTRRGEAFSVGARFLSVSLPAAERLRSYVSAVPDPKG